MINHLESHVERTTRLVEQRDAYRDGYDRRGEMLRQVYCLLASVDLGAMRAGDAARVEIVRREIGAEIGV